LTVHLIMSELLWLSNQTQKRTSGTNNLDTWEYKASRDSQENLAVGFNYDTSRQLTMKPPLKGNNTETSSPLVTLELKNLWD